MDAGPTGSSFAKKLASCNQSTRSKALKLLNTWLASQKHVSEEEMLMIWKGLFYCVWHADKQKFQIDLINRLASQLVSTDLILSISYFEVFILTMRREWSAIDFLRLDKFYLLIRRFLHNVFLLLKRQSWDLQVTIRFMAILEQRTLLTVDKYPAQGVNHHISEIFLDELKEFLPVGAESLNVLFKPFFCVLEKSQDKVLLKKIKSSMFNCLLENGKKLLDLKKSGDNVDSGDDVVKLGTIALVMKSSTKFFNSASSSNAFQGNRKILFSLSEGFLKLEKDLENSGVEILIPQVNVDKGEENVLNKGSELTTALNVSSKQVEAVSVLANGSNKRPPKNCRKTKQAIGTGRKSETKKNKLSDSAKVENNLAPEHENDIGNKSNDNARDAENFIADSESVISNLQKQFEKVAAEASMDTDTSLCSIPTVVVSNTGAKKRKRAKTMDEQAAVNLDSSNDGIFGGTITEKCAKRVRFSMKNNLVWKPHNPLPPESLRLPPSATPRGSALKKGIPPGPIREIPAKKVKKKVNAMKKGRKSSKGVSPAIKRLRKLQSFSV